MSINKPLSENDFLIKNKTKGKIRLKQNNDMPIIKVSLVNFLSSISIRPLRKNSF